MIVQNGLSEIDLFDDVLCLETMLLVGLLGLKNLGCVNAPKVLKRWFFSEVHKFRILDFSLGETFMSKVKKPDHDGSFVTLTHPIVCGVAYILGIIWQIKS